VRKEKRCDKEVGRRGSATTSGGSGAEEHKDEDGAENEPGNQNQAAQPEPARNSAALRHETAGKNGDDDGKSQSARSK
jgi:hypothetical protein